MEGSQTPRMPMMRLTRSVYSGIPSVLSRIVSGTDFGISPLMKSNIITLDKGQSTTLQTETFSELHVSLKEGQQDYSLQVTGGGASYEVTIDNITKPLDVDPKSEVTLTLTKGDPNISYDFMVWLK